MANDYLATYLNDHLAGATMGVELLKHLRKKHDDQAAADVLAQLHLDVEQDRNTLKAILARAGIKESEPRKAAGWMADKAAQAKLHLDDPKGGALAKYEMLETMSLGIEGKRSLWTALDTAAVGVPNIREFDLGELKRRAEAQRSILEKLRLLAAVEAFTTRS